jgi:hypothetical protein
MIPYLSSSPLPFNATAENENPFDATATIVTGVAVGAMGVGSVAILFQHLRRAPKASDKKEEEKQEKEEKEEKEETEIQMPDALTYLCINTVDLEDVTFLLNLFRKRYHLIETPANLTAGLPH